MATHDTPHATLSMAPTARPAFPTPLSSGTTKRRTLSAIGTVKASDRLGDRPAVLLAIASLPFLALAAAIRRRRSTRESPTGRVK